MSHCVFLLSPFPSLSLIYSNPLLFLFLCVSSCLTHFFSYSYFSNYSHIFLKFLIFFESILISKIFKLSPKLSVKSPQKYPNFHANLFFLLFPNFLFVFFSCQLSFPLSSRRPYPQNCPSFCYTLSLFSFSSYHLITHQFSKCLVFCSAFFFGNTSIILFLIIPHPPLFNFHSYF